MVQFFYFLTNTRLRLIYLLHVNKITCEKRPVFFFSLYFLIYVRSELEGNKNTTEQWKVLQLC